MTHTVAPGSPFPSDHLSTALADLKRQRPLVQCLTNAVVTNFTANALLAAGAAPAMTDIVGESGDFARIADAVLINLGTPTPEQREAMVEAAAVCQETGTPWVLDPVAVGSLAVRTHLARDLLQFKPAVVRGNASEIIGLCGGAGGRGTDTTDQPGDALDAARTLLTDHGVQAVAISGEVDLIVGATDHGEVAWHVPHGHRYLTQVTGGGCALGAVIAACLAVQADPVEAAVAGSVLWEVAAEHAAARANGPGSFAVELLDQLNSLAPEALASQGAVTCAEVAL
ncbi:MULTISPECIES: hydroxyethylthiazole kinase [Kocuria]|uniref:Hydroxyethylthiazole kinase n=1 Tax=Kocuria subflava TaxID=1736139 RepID=A0A846TV31_9MICC|nr:MULTISPECIES: hydroxyethylthiazole kinase [Kocuria]NKE09594.1 hydroxyethylthiazole kinase [Kocuria subflava]